MAVTIAEYLGQRVDVEAPIKPITSKATNCPFMEKACEKLKKNNKPICSARKGVLYG